MPTVLQVQGFRVRMLLPPRERPPPHVHVTKGDGEVVILLPGAAGVVAIRTVQPHAGGGCRNRRPARGGPPHAA